MINNRTFNQSIERKNLIQTIYLFFRFWGLDIKQKKKSWNKLWTNVQKYADLFLLYLYWSCKRYKKDKQPYIALEKTKEQDGWLPLAFLL